MPPSPAPSQACCVCGAGLRTAFPGRLLEDVEVTYAACTDCGTLQLPAPHWLERAYGQKLVPDPDAGALRRGLFLLRVIRRLRASGILPRKPRAMDFGAGKGLLVRAMLDLKFDAWGYDLYPAPAYAEERIGPELPGGPFDFILCSEVLEHSPEPVALLERLRSRMAAKAVLLLTTELFDPRRHGPDWHYLAPELGQHITFCTSEGLRLASGKAGLDWFGTLRWREDRNFQAHLLAPAGRPPAWPLRALLRILHGANEAFQRSDFLA